MTQNAWVIGALVGNCQVTTAVGFIGIKTFGANDLNL